MRVLFLTNDLMFPSRVSASARRHGIRVDVIASVDALAKRAASHDVKLILLDLSMQLDLPGLLTRIKPDGVSQADVVAFGPHVDEPTLAAAVEAGCDEVLSRGQFTARIDELLARCAATQN